MDGRDGVVLQQDGAWEIRFERRLAHSPERVWQAIVGPGQMSRWFDETHMPEPLRVGATIRFHHAILDAGSEGEITALEPGRLIEWLWRGPFGPPTPIRWEVTPDGEGSRLVMRQRIEDPSMLGRTTAGWYVCLDKLDAVAGGRDDEDASRRWPALFESYKAMLRGQGVAADQAGPPRPKD